jgi:MFS family permease
MNPYFVRNRNIAQNQPAILTVIQNSRRIIMDFVFWLQWLIVSTLGMGLGLYLGETVAHQSNFLTGFITRGLASGAFLGVLQWFILKRRVSQTGWWILASIFGWALAFTVGWSAGFGVGWAIGISSGWNTGHKIAFIIGGLLGGAIVGLFQWLVLRKHIPESGWVILTSAVGASIGWFASWQLEFVRVTGWVGNSLTFANSGLLAGATSGSIYGALTGATLVWLFSRTASYPFSRTHTSSSNMNGLDKSETEFRVTVAALIFTVLSFIVALLAWLYPLDPVRSTPFK